MTTVTAAVGTLPPGTVIDRVYAPQVAIHRPSTVKPNAGPFQDLLEWLPQAGFVVIVETTQDRGRESLGARLVEVGQLRFSQMRWQWSGRHGPVNRTAQARGPGVSSRFV